MKKQLILTGILLAGINLLAFSQDNRNHNRDQRDNYGTDGRNSHRKKTIKEDLVNKIEFLENDFSGKLSRRDKAEFQQRIDEILYLVDRLPQEVIVEERMPMAISASELNSLIAEIKKASFDDDKKRIINASLNYNLFTIDQVITVVNMFSFDQVKLDVIKMFYPRIIDANKSYQLYNCLRFDSERKKLEQFIKEYESRPGR